MVNKKQIDFNKVGKLHCQIQKELNKDSESIGSVLFCFKKTDEDCKIETLTYSIIDKQFKYKCHLALKDILENVYAEDF